MNLTYYYDISTNDGRILRFSTTSDKASEKDFEAFFVNALKGVSESGLGFLIVPDWITVTEIEEE